jgi:hypothetical protein
MSGLSLFAQVGKGSNDPLRTPEVIWGTAGLALALLAGALLVYVADRWRKKSAAPIEDTSRELTDFRRMFERGEITEEEYVKLRDKVAQRVKSPPPVPVSVPMTQQNLSSAGPASPVSMPGPDQSTTPPDSGKPANPPSPA